VTVKEAVPVPTVGDVITYETVLKTPAVIVAAAQAFVIAIVKVLTAVKTLY
jgi:hypothetical protein